MRSVIAVRSMHGRNIHPTEKPLGILDPLIRYGCPPGGMVLDPFAGSGSTAEAARQTGRRAILIEADERYCEAIVRRMAQGVLLDPADTIAAAAHADDQAELAAEAAELDAIERSET
jgi:site-specific DNA-methyltransferase (adenine-specific)